MSEKRHKINKIANYQNIKVGNSPAFDHHAFVSSQDRWFMVFDVMRMISTQIRWQEPCWSLCKLWEHRLDFIQENIWEVAFPPGPYLLTLSSKFALYLIQMAQAYSKKGLQLNTIDTHIKQCCLMSHVFVICKIECITVQLMTQSNKLIQHPKVLEITYNVKYHNTKVWHTIRAVTKIFQVPE